MSISQSTSGRHHHNHHSSAAGGSARTSSAAAAAAAAFKVGGLPVQCCSKCYAVLPSTNKPANSVSAPRTPTTPTRCQQLSECSVHQPQSEKPATVTATTNSATLSKSPFATGAVALPPSSHCRCSRALQFDEDDASTRSSTEAVNPTMTIASLNSGITTMLAAAAPSETIQSCSTSIAATAAGPLLCAKCRTVERENSQTKSKLDQLRLVMQQKKARREARKLQTAPYAPSLPAGLNSSTACQATVDASAGGDATAAVATQSTPASPTSSSSTGPVELTAAEPMPEMNSNSNNNNNGGLAEEVDTAA